MKIVEGFRIPRITWKSGDSGREILAFAASRLDAIEDREEPGPAILLIPEFDKNVTARWNFDGSDLTFAAVLQEIANACDLEIYATNVGLVAKPPGIPPFPNGKAEEGQIFVVFKPVPRQ